MSRYKIGTKKRKWGVTWIYLLNKTWFVNSGSDANKCGILCGVSTKQLNSPKELRRLAPSEFKSYWDKYIKR